MIQKRNIQKHRRFDKLSDTETAPGYHRIVGDIDNANEALYRASEMQKKGTNVVVVLYGEGKRFVGEEL